MSEELKTQKCKAFVENVVTLLNLLSTCVAVNFSRRTRFHGFN